MVRTIVAFVTFSLVSLHIAAAEPDPKAIIRSAMELWRGTTSYSQMTMTIHRPDWQRVMTMTAWTEGDKNSLVRVEAPKKDAGNATLLKDNSMWTFSPKVNRVIRIPSSMMNQSWMGGDFSNKDISKSTDIIDQYEHKLDKVIQQDGHDIYVITAIPHEDAAVVWGKEVLYIRDDYVLMEEQFWDQDDLLVKTMKAMSVGEMGGRVIATRMRMTKQDAPEEWTEMETLSAKFDVKLNPHVFTLSNLRNPR